MKKKTKITKKTKRKKHQTYKRKKSLRGGSDTSFAWNGVADPEQPTGFGWLYKSFFKPCR